MAEVIRRAYRLTGVVQGVGFRPHVAQVAQRYPITGLCGNDDVSVFIEAQGSAHTIDAFMREVLDTLPPLACVIDVSSRDIPLVPEENHEGATEQRHPAFHIVASQRVSGARTLIPPDVSICPECWNDIHDPANRRYGYAFTTCTNCGPRLSIIRDLPYDRPFTTMRDFPMCAECEAEYVNSSDRRFHAQPISCYHCGPHMWLVHSNEIAQPDPFAAFDSCSAFDDDTQSGAARGGRTHAEQNAVLAEARELLRQGKILAVKGIGGFHLLVDATNPEAVRRLRTRKQRSDKPFAVMVASLEQARQEVELTSEDERLLTSIARPIVLAPRASGGMVCAEVAPGLDSLGVLIAYTPLHVLLLEGLGPVVATSGNLADEPLCYRNADVLARLRCVADAFVLHNRDIHVPVEDSVVYSGGKLHSVPTHVRRSRGYAPLPVVVHNPAHTGGSSQPTEQSQPNMQHALETESQLPTVLAVGGELKNTFALVRGNTVFMSAHIGDMGSLAAQEAFEAAAMQMLRIHRAEPSVVVYDKHPNYATTSWAKRYCARLREQDVPVRELSLQHHCAHALALAAESGEREMIVASVDGTGFGDDGTIWGGEVIGVQGVSTERLWHIPPFMLAGGDQAVKEAWRCGLGLCEAYRIDYAGTPLAQAAQAPAGKLVLSQLHARIGTVSTTSLGRVFDAIAALVGITESNYEAQAATLFQQLALDYWASLEHSGASKRAGSGNGDEYTGGLAEGCAHEEFRAVVANAVAQARQGADPRRIAYEFHQGVARIFAGVLITHSRERGNVPVGVSGGVALNQLFVRLLGEYVQEAGLRFVTHSVVPPNDGGLALGQAYYGLFAHQEHAGGVVEDGAVEDTVPQNTVN